MYNVAIIGAGPAGIFSALEIVKLRPEWKVVLIEKGQKIEKRICPIRNGSPKCVNCKKCGLLCGWGGAGAFSDGKLSLCYEVGGDLPNLIGQEKAQSLINYTDTIYLEFGADTKVEGISNPEKTKEIRKRAIKNDPSYAVMLCRCETVTEGDVLNAIHRPIKAHTVDMVKRRTRAGMGRCQGAYCRERVAELIARELKIDISEVKKFSSNSKLLIGKTK